MHPREVPKQVQSRRKARDLLIELGRRGMVGGQEDMIEDTSITMARSRANPTRVAA